MVTPSEDVLYCLKLEFQKNTTVGFQFDYACYKSLVELRVLLFAYLMY